ncbi:hypothetical protein [Streptomyces tibetensis]|uniref:hypothetical protein n=1 Tax=Streptomyces tibetensis TaxID=2382123 RepID=UPI0033E039E2
MSTPHTPATSADTPKPGPAGKLRRCLRMPIGVQSIIAVGLGALLGTFAPSAGEQMKILGDVFLTWSRSSSCPWSSRSSCWASPAWSR